MVKQDYYKLGLVTEFYNDQKAVRDILDDNTTVMEGFNDLSNDPNKAAIEEINTKLKDENALHKTVTVKSLVEFFTKRPYGWRDLEVLGMLAKLWKNGIVQFTIHDVTVTDSDGKFKNDYPRKQGIDTIVIKLKKKIDDETLYAVKKIMKEVYSLDLPLDEAKLFEGVVNFFSSKTELISNLKIKYKSDYVGSAFASKIYTEFDAILRSNDPSTVFEEIISRKAFLDENAETLSALEKFHKENSNQQKSFKEALEIVDWFNENQILEDLSSLSDTVNAITGNVTVAAVKIKSFSFIYTFQKFI